MPGHCPPVITCDFNIDVCGWTKDLSLDWIWDHGIGRVEHSDSLAPRVKYPPKDIGRAGGMYMYTDFTSLIQGQGNMILMSEFVPATSGSCFSFDYIPLNFQNINNKFDIILMDGMFFRWN